jgi:riboflavin kinase/FMN adenylyltransferase
MAIFYKTDNLPTFKKAVITIGTFDGIHKGHREILKEVVDHAREIAGESLVITFEPHPRKVLFPEQPIKLLTPLKQKLQLLADTGINHIVVAPFTTKFSTLSANDYIGEFLIKHFHPEAIVIGYDHHFGHDRTGDIKLLRELESKHGYKVHEIPAQLIEQAAVSSTKIRASLQLGHVREVAPMMGRCYSLIGTVKEGDKLGRTIGYPTANIDLSDPDQLIPANGVYAVKVKVKKAQHGGMLNIGFRPTVTGEKKLSIEAHLFALNENIYSEEIEVVFIERLRDEEKFNSVEELKQQLDVDKKNAISIIDGHKDISA